MKLYDYSSIRLLAAHVRRLQEILSSWYHSAGLIGCCRIIDSPQMTTVFLFPRRVAGNASFHPSTYEAIPTYWDLRREITIMRAYKI